VRLDTVVLSTQHADGIDLEHTLTPDIREKVVNTVLNDLGHDTMDTSDYRLLVNPTGKFVLGGPMGDAGLTGRKIIVDTYGGWARHGGGAFSGKDPSKVDRSAAYAMRWVATNVVAAGLADRCEAQVAYAIGKAHPVSLFVETFGTENVPVDRIEKAIGEVFDLRPAAIIRDLDLLRPIYQQTARYGHFGRELPDFTWERTDRVADLMSAAGTLADVLRLAVPPRHARAEASAWPPVGGPPDPRPHWDRYPAGDAYLRALADGRAPRAVWTALPGEDWPDRLAEAAAAVSSGGHSGARGAVLIVPDARDLDRLDAALTRALGTGRHVTLSAALGPQERYRRFLAVSRGQVRIVAGTRAAAFAPAHPLGLVAVWDDRAGLPRGPRPPDPRARA